MAAPLDLSATQARVSTAFKTLYVVIWFESDYNHSSSLDNGEFQHCVFHSQEDAERSVRERFKDIPALTTEFLGDVFLYPSGDDGEFDVFEIFLPVNHRLSQFFAKGAESVSFSKDPDTQEGKTLKREVMCALDSSLCRRMSLSMPNLSPKPVHPQRSRFAWGVPDGSDDKGASITTIDFSKEL